MKKWIMILLLFSCNYILTNQIYSESIQKAYKQHKEEKSTFTLITILYNEKNKERIKEYITCLEQNLLNNVIDTIHVVYDTSKDSTNNKILTYLKTAAVKISYVKGRPTYGYCFTLANKLYPNSKVILSNADIYFNETLALLKDYDLTNRFLAITRWNVQKNGEIQPFIRSGGKRAENSQDAWIFKTLLKKFVDTIEMGLPGCDKRISYYAQQGGLEVLNPCLTIQCCHLHLSEIRSYHKDGTRYPKWKDAINLSWSELNE